MFRCEIFAFKVFTPTAYRTCNANTGIHFSTLICKVLATPPPEFHHPIDEFKLYLGPFRMYFKMLVGQFAALLQMLAPCILNERSLYLISPNDRRYFFLIFEIVGIFAIVVQFVKEVLREADDVAVVGDTTSVLHHHYDSMMRLLAVGKFGKIDPRPIK